MHLIITDITTVPPTAQDSSRCDRCLTPFAKGALAIMVRLEVFRTGVYAATLALCSDCRFDLTAASDS